MEGFEAPAGVTIIALGSARPSYFPRRQALRPMSRHAGSWIGQDLNLHAVVCGAASAAVRLHSATDPKRRETRPRLATNQRPHGQYEFRFCRRASLGRPSPLPSLQRACAQSDSWALLVSSIWFPVPPFAFLLCRCKRTRMPTRSASRARLAFDLPVCSRSVASSRSVRSSARIAHRPSITRLMMGRFGAKNKS